MPDPVTGGNARRHGGVDAGIDAGSRCWLFGVMNTSPFVPADLDSPDVSLRVAVAVHPARYKGSSRLHTESDLGSYLTWCRSHDLNPLQARRPHIELYLRWMQEVQRFQPSTVSRRLSIVAGFYRTCVIDTVLEHSPAEHVRRPRVSADSPTLGLSHLQFEALLGAARDSANRHDFALVAMLGLLGLRIFEATGADITDLSEVHGHRVLTVLGRGDKLAVLPLPPAVARAIDHATAGRAEGPILRNRAGGRMSRHSATRRRLRRHSRSDASAHAPPHLRHQHARRRRRPPHHHALRPSPQEPPPTPQLHPRRLHGLRH